MEARAREAVDGCERALSDTQREVGRIGGALAQADEQLRRLGERRRRLDAVLHEASQLARERELLGGARTVLQQAGPTLARMYTERITRDATAIYRAIGDAGEGRRVRLDWASDFELGLVDGRGRRRSFAMLSGGEQMSAALAVRLAIFQVLGRRVRLGIFDEPTSNLDPLRRTLLAHQLCSLDCERYGQIFVVSHDDAFRRYAEHIVEAQGHALDATG
jgi:exonuclease SbcC